jgi:hypothetical protein
MRGSVRLYCHANAFFFGIGIDSSSTGSTFVEGVAMGYAFDSLARRLLIESFFFIASQAYSSY